MTEPSAPPDSALSRIVSAVLTGALAGGAASALVVWAPALWDVATGHPSLDRGVAWLGMYAGSAALSATLFLVALTVLALLAYRLAPARPMPGAPAAAVGGGLLAGLLTLGPALIGGGLAHVPWLFVGGAIAGGVAAGAVAARAGRVREPG